MGLHDSMCPAGIGIRKDTFSDDVFSSADIVISNAVGVARVGAVQHLQWDAGCGWDLFG